MAKRLIGAVTTIVLVATALGLACWFAFSAVTGATLITFRTGSMSPTMPQGSLAATVPVTAAELQVGDVVTVQRAGERMPVTHRVVEIGEVPPQAENAPDLRAAAPGGTPPDPLSPDARQIVMQGDDNDAPDHLPYIVADVRRTVFAVPHAGTALMLLQSPISTGALIIGVGALVVWAFWPRREDRAPEHEGASEHEHPGERADEYAEGSASAEPGGRTLVPRAAAGRHGAAPVRGAVSR